MKTKANNTKYTENIMKYCKENNLPFTLEKTLFTRKLICELGEFYWSAQTDLSQKDLSFIKSVKDYCSKLPNIPTIDKSKISYTKLGKIKNSIYTKDLHEIDLRSAYWNFAKQENFISNEIFEKGKEVRKKVRLMALGNLAKRTGVFEWNGKEFNNVFFKNSDITENIFFKVSQMTDVIMQHCRMVAGNNYMFYWVDAIFLQTESSKRYVCEFLQDNDLEFKSTVIDKLHKKRNVIEIHDCEHKHPRKFIFENLSSNNSNFISNEKKPIQSNVFI